MSSSGLILSPELSALLITPEQTEDTGRLRPRRPGCDHWRMDGVRETVTTSVYWHLDAIKQFILRHNEGWIHFSRDEAQWDGLKLKQRRRERTEGDMIQIIHMSLRQNNECPCPWSRVIRWQGSYQCQVLCQQRRQCYKLSGVTLDKSASKPLGHKGALVMPHKPIRDQQGWQLTNQKTDGAGRRLS